MYSSTLNSEESLKVDFYAQLQVNIDRIPLRDVLVYAGDWHARTGPKTNGRVRELFRIKMICGYNHPFSTPPPTVSY